MNTFPGMTCFRVSDSLNFYFTVRRYCYFIPVFLLFIYKQTLTPVALIVDFNFHGVDSFLLKRDTIIDG